MVAWHDDHFPAAPEPRADCPQHRLGGRHCLLWPPLQKFDHVTEQNQPVDAVERVEQRLERLGMTKHIATQTSAEMKI